KQAQDLYAKRSFWMWWDEDLPLLYLEGVLPAEQGAAVQQALERRAEQVVLAEEAAGRPMEARLADALVELVTGDAGGEVAPATLVVHADAAVLTSADLEDGSALGAGDGPELAETESGQRVCSETVRRLAC